MYRRRRSRHNEERRRAAFLVFWKIVAGVATLGVTAYYAYETGVKVTQGDSGSLRDRLSETEARLEALSRQAESDRQAVQAARKEADEARKLYEQVKPGEAISDLVAQIRARLAAGVEPRRLALVIKTTEPLKGCEPAMVKRVLVHTPASKNPAQTTRVAEGVSLSLEGEGANGGRDPWFNPEQALTVSVAASGYRDRTLTERLPIEDRVVLRGAETRISIAPSQTRGFVEVSTERCPL